MIVRNHYQCLLVFTAVLLPLLVSSMHRNELSVGAFIRDNKIAEDAAANHNDAEDDDVEDFKMGDSVHHVRPMNSPGCNFIWHKRKCSDGCCLRFRNKIYKCLPCRWKFYTGCGAYLNPPHRGPILHTATHPSNDQSNWMYRYRNKKLKEMILPGSHHSGISVRPGSHLLDKWDIPEAMSVTKQLRAGIRFLDVRVATGPFLRQPSITHNYKYQDFVFLVRDTVNFLKRHTHEVVVMVLSEGKKDTNYYGFKFNWKTNWNRVDRDLARYKGHVYTGRNPLNKRISQLRGKLVICQERKQSSFYRMKCDGSWSNTHTNNPHTLMTRMSRWVRTRPHYSSFTFYFLEAILTPTDSDVKNSINPFSCKRRGNQALYQYNSLKDLAATANYYVYVWLRGKGYIKSRAGAVMTDFVNPHVINRIIAMN